VDRALLDDDIAAADDDDADAFLETVAADDMDGDDSVVLMRLSGLDTASDGARTDTAVLVAGDRVLTTAVAPPSLASLLG
jgi:hypothetical protein